MDIWITLSEKAFKKVDCVKLNAFGVSCLRINLSRESDKWIMDALFTLQQNKFNLSNIFLDIANNKPRIIFAEATKIMYVNTNDEILLSKAKGIFTVSDFSFFENLKKGNIVIFGDGLIEFEVIEIDQTGVKLRALSSGSIKNLTSLFITQNEFSNFHLDNNEIKRVNEILIQYPVGLMLSFVQQACDVLESKKVFPNAKMIIPKIETKLAFLNVEDICKVSEKIVIGRGDLGLAVGIEKIGIVQRDILTKARVLKKPVIIATETLESFTFRPYPFRSEVIDITNSYINGAEAILLTSETASLENPYLPISFLRKTISYLNNI